MLVFIGYKEDRLVQGRGADVYIGYAEGRH